MTMKYGLSENELNTLNQLALAPLKNYGAHVWIFGSRARGDYKKFSDVDLLYDFENCEIPTGIIAEIKEKLENSNFAYKVDLVNKKEIAKSYEKNILKDCQAL